jgi:apolipoprotein D and lipocalin family protein
MAARLALWLLLFSMVACSTTEPRMTTVPEVDLSRYSGTWYEIASYPVWFQRRCATDTKAIYEPLPEGAIRVINQCRTREGEILQVEGKAKVVPGSGNSKLRVRFGWIPFAGDYWIIGLDRKNYQWAVVGHPSRKFLWFLARTPGVSEETFRQMEEAAEKQGYDLSPLRRTTQSAAGK